MVNFYNGFLNADFAAACSRVESEYDALWQRHANDLRAGCAAEQKWAASLSAVPLARLVEHIDHIVKVAGIDDVALGSDFDGVEITPTGLEDVSCYPNLTLALRHRGYSNRDVQKILGENFLRVLREAEQFASQSQVRRRMTTR